MPQELAAARDCQRGSGLAYRLPVKHAPAQLAATGCFNGAFYATAADQLDTLHALVAELEDNTFLAKLAIYSRERALMKDMPAALLVMLSKRDPRWPAGCSTAWSTTAACCARCCR